MVLKASEIPEGSGKIVRIRDIEVGVFNIGGTYSAIANRCPHEGGPTCTGYVTGTVTCDRSRGWIPKWIKDGEVVCCPWHGYEFEIQTGKCLTRKDLRIRTYKVEAVNDEIRIEL